MSKWKPIGTAPTNDDSVNVGMLLWVDGELIRGFRDWEDDSQFLDQDGSPLDHYPTHWMPLPKPPAQ
jgi:hypothetical protein